MSVVIALKTRHNYRNYKQNTLCEKKKKQEKNYKNNT